MTDHTNFLKAPLAPICTNFEREGARAKKKQFFGQIFPKSAKKRLFGLFFEKFCLRRRNFDQNRDFLALWESSKNQFGRPKKKVDKISERFFKIRPPSEKNFDPLLAFSDVVELVEFKN